MKATVLRVFGVGVLSTGALIIDEKTGIGLGTLGVVISGLWWLGRKLQVLEDFMTDSKEWRRMVSDEQTLARKEREQILRHQEINRQRQELILKQLDTIEEAKRIYGEVLLRLENMKIQIADKQLQSTGESTTQ